MPEEQKKNLGLALLGKSRERMLGAGNPMYWNPNREEQALKKRMERTWRHLIARVFRRSGTKKEKTTFELLGYSASQLKTYIENQFQEGMSWENHGSGPGKWNLDHIKPICKFPLDADPKEVNALSNLRPLWYEENMSRTRQRS
jgi:hypothetical protein